MIDEVYKTQSVNWYMHNSHTSFSSALSDMLPDFLDIR